MNQPEDDRFPFGFRRLTLRSADEVGTACPALLIAGDFVKNVTRLPGLNGEPVKRCNVNNPLTLLRAAMPIPVGLYPIGIER